MTDEDLATKNGWLKRDRIVRHGVKPRKTKYIKNNYYQGPCNLYAEEDTREPKNRQEEILVWLFNQLNPLKKDWYYQPKEDKRGFKKSKLRGSDQPTPLDFQKVSAHFKGTGVTLGLTFRAESHWFRIDLDNHNYDNYGKIIGEFCSIYQYLVNHERDLKKRGIRWFIEYREDLSSFHFDFWFQYPVSIQAGRRFVKEILTKLNIDAEVFVSQQQNCKLFGCVQYRQLLNKIYRLPNIEIFFDFLNDTEVYEHPTLAWVRDTLNFDDYLYYNNSEVKLPDVIKTVPKLEPKNLEEKFDEIRRLVCKGQTWHIIVDFFKGDQKHEVGRLNTVVLIVSMIAMFQGKKRDEIIEKIIHNLATIRKNRRVSSDFLSTEQQKRKRIMELVEAAIEFRYERDKAMAKRKLEITAKRFTDTGRDVLNLETMGDRGSNYNNVGAFPQNPINLIPSSYQSEIINSLTPLFPKKLKNNALPIAIAIAQFCFLQYQQNRPTSKSYFINFFKKELAWQPRKGGDLYKILDRLVDLGIIKRIDMQTIKVSVPSAAQPQKISRQTMVWGLGDRLARDIGIEPTSKTYTKSIYHSPEVLTELTGSYID